jgi:hypothetical protein
VVGGRFADCVPAWEEAPVIHPVARGGPECRAVLGGSIKRAAVLLVCEEEARHTGMRIRVRKRSAIVSGGGFSVVGPGGWGFRGRTQIGQAAICSLGFEPVDIAGRPCD